MDDKDLAIEVQDSIADLIRTFGLPAPEPADGLQVVMIKIKAALEYLIERKKPR